MKNRLAILLITGAFPIFSMGQSLPRNYFSSPLDTPIVITGTFGEIREDHLHSGIDLSTDDQEGVPVMSAADGYVSRVKVSADGYGKAIYITHPNGYVSVYGHLQKFTAPINEMVRKLQYEKQVFEVDIQPKDREYKVKQGEVIAYSGSTGGAEGPHLHFEIRDERTEEPINPFLFGIWVQDTKPPVIQNVRIFPERLGGFLNKADSAETYDIITEDGVYKLNTVEYPIVYGNISFGVGAVDSMNNSSATLGIYSSELFVDDKPVFTWRYDRFNFNRTRDVNAHIDYMAYKRDNLKIERYFKLPGDKLELYGGDSTMTGKVLFQEDGSHNIKMVVRDFKGNHSQIEFQVITYNSLSETPYQPVDPNALLVTNEKGVAVHKAKLDVIIPEDDVYQNYYYTDDSHKNSDYLSDVFRVGDPYEALRIPITVGIKPNNEIPDSLKSKALIVRLEDDETVSPCGGQWNGKFLSGKSNRFGKFAVVLDTIPPTAEKYYTPADMNNMYGGQVQIKVKDALSGIKSYSGRIDGKWYLFEYDKKNDMLIANVDPMSTNQDHNVELTLTDERGNSTIWKMSFYF